MGKLVSFCKKIGKENLLFTHDAIVRFCVGHNVIHFISSWMHSNFFFFILEGGHIGWPIINSLEIVHSTSRNASLHPKLPNRNRCAAYCQPFKVIYMGVELWVNHMG